MNQKIRGMEKKSNYCIILSPSKTLKEFRGTINIATSTPRYLSYSQELVKQLRAFSPKELSSLMGISPKLADLNFIRFAQWHLPFTHQNSFPAILSFAGDVYEGLRADDFTADELLFANERIFILSGLYGVLRALDLMQPYRLEMGTRFDILNSYSTLYQFWGNRISEFLKEHVENGYIVNLASQEYSKVIDKNLFGKRFLTIEFRENRSNGLKVIPILSKRARGLMARFAVKNRVVNVDELKLFDYEGYTYSDSLSSGTNWVFIR